MNRRRTAIVCAAVFLSLGTGCDRAPNAAALQAKFDEAERLCLDQRYEDAQKLLKEYLLLDPDHPGAHFYLARTYMASRDIRETSLAENEYQMALRLFERQGRVSGIKRFDPRYFEMMCHLNSATTLEIQARILAQDRTLIPVALESLRRALEYVERARAVNPKASEIEIVGEPIRELAGRLQAAAR